MALQLTPEREEGGARPEELALAASLFRPWDTPESLSPSSGQSISPSSSENISPSSSNSSPDSAKSSSPASASLPPPQVVYDDATGAMLYTLAPLPAAGPWVSPPADRPSAGSKRRRRLQAAAASPALARRPGGRPEFPPCGVCGEESTGVHYGAAVCEGCKGFFRRRVVYRDVATLVCGSGGSCSVAGRGRIHCKLCRYNSCIQAGMDPNAVRQEPRHGREHLGWLDQVVLSHKETLTAVPAVYLGRRHTEELARATAAIWPDSADLGPAGGAGPTDSARFVQSLPDFGQLEPQARQFALTTGTLQVSLARLLSRYRPEVGAFLFPCGQFLLPSQLAGRLPPRAVAGLTRAAASQAARALTTPELALLCASLAVCPLHRSPLLTSCLTALAQQPSGPHLVGLGLQVVELATLAPANVWSALSPAPIQSSINT